MFARRQANAAKVVIDSELRLMSIDVCAPAGIMVSLNTRIVGPADFRLYRHSISLVTGHPSFSVLIRRLR